MVAALGIEPHALGLGCQIPDKRHYWMLAQRIAAPYSHILSRLVDISGQGRIVVLFRGKMNQSGEKHLRDWETLTEWRRVVNSNSWFLFLRETALLDLVPEKYSPIVRLLRILEDNAAPGRSTIAHYGRRNRLP